VQPFAAVVDGVVQPFATVLDHVVQMLATVPDGPVRPFAAVLDHVVAELPAGLVGFGHRKAFGSGHREPPAGCEPVGAIGVKLPTRMRVHTAVAL
jgi:hypothetical protein